MELLTGPVGVASPACTHSTEARHTQVHTGPERRELLCVDYLAERGFGGLPGQAGLRPLELRTYCPSQAAGQLALIPWPSSPPWPVGCAPPSSAPPSVLSNRPLPPGFWIFHPVTTVTGLGGS